MINNIDELIEKANSIEDEERLSYVLNYFLNNIEYDYACLLASGYVRENISEIGGYVTEINPFKTGEIDGYNDSYCISIKIVGESNMLNEIHNIYMNSKDKQSFFINLRDYLTNELKKHVTNIDVVNKNIDNLMTKIENDMQKHAIINNTYYASYNAKTVFCNYIIHKKENFPEIIENGILKKGICDTFSNYLNDLLPKIGINTVKIIGKSELAHAWNAVIVNNKLKSIDLTRAVFIRDGFKGIPEDQKSTDWLISDFKDVFKMQETRTIESISNGPKLDQVITKDNYDEEKLIDIVLDALNNNSKKIN